MGGLGVRALEPSGRYNAALWLLTIGRDGVSNSKAEATLGHSEGLKWRGKTKRAEEVAGRGKGPAKQRCRECRLSKKRDQSGIETWLAEADKSLEDACALEDKIRAGGLLSRLNWSQRCWLSYDIEYLKRKIFSHVVLATLWESDFATHFMPSQSLKSALLGVMSAVKDEHGPGVIAVCGRRGVGKTSLANLLERKAQALLNFKAKKLVISQSTNAEQVQQELAAFLGLPLQQICADERAERLRLELKSQGRNLIILDNVCKELNLVSIGIPNHVNCRVVVTVSDVQLLESCGIRNSKVIRLEPLDKAEAWKLLEDNLSSDISSEIKQVAKQIAEEFEHCTVSILTLGRALKGEVLDEWMKAYKSLKSEQEKIEKRSIEIVYRSAIKTLEKSFLLSKQGKTHVRTPSVIREAALLVASRDDNEFLRIKSLVGLWERRNKEDLESYTAIFYVASRQEELDDMEFPSEKLQILLLSGSNYQISNVFLQRLTALKVVAVHSGVLSLNALQNLINLKALHLEHCKLDGLSSLVKLEQLEILSFQGSDISELPDEIGELKNLILLDLSCCQKLLRTPLYLIRRLLQLEELYFSGLSFGEWWSKERSAEGVDISPSMINSLFSWATESFQKQGSHSKPRALKVSALFQNESNELNLKSTVTYLDRVRILVVRNHVVPNLVQSVKKVKVKHCYNWEKVFQNGRILHAGEDDSGALLSNLTSLDLEYVSRLSSLVIICSGQTLQNLTTLKLNGCCNLQFLFSMTLAQSLKQLETLEICGCKELKQIIAETTGAVDVGVNEQVHPVVVNVNSGVNESVHPVPLHHQYLPRLKTLLITGCDALEYIFQLPKGQVFPELTQLEMRNCLQLKEVFSFKQGAEWKENVVPRSSSWRPRVFVLILYNLSIKLPELQHLEAGACRKLSKKALFKLIGNCQLKELRLFNVGNQLCENLFDYEGGCLLSCLEKLRLHNLYELRSIWTVSAQMVTLQKLTCLEMVKCSKLKNLFSPLLARNLLELKNLIVRECDDLVQLISRDQIPSSSSSPLPSASGYKPVYFPNLEEILIEDCNKLKNLFPVSVACFPNLQKFSVVRAFALVEIFGHEEGKAKVKSGKEITKAKIEKENVKLQFLKLETLQLKKLPTLVTFNPVDYCCEFPQLKSLQVKDCTCLATKFETSESASDHTVYTKTNETLLPIPEKPEVKLRRSVTVVEIPTSNGDIDWSPGMKMN
ncbi:hypothetical protein V6N11_038689 [Hibiscus sabdariffa]|uniref:AAA+ ATPase domain-containing protein n=1 Tax=Hibiscus sabdariffa TaxID=183260 RepID=A0ABR2SLM8_9ROSI